MTETLRLDVASPSPARELTVTCTVSSRVADWAVASLGPSPSAAATMTHAPTRAERREESSTDATEISLMMEKRRSFAERVRYGDETVFETKDTYSADLTPISPRDACHAECAWP
jgi:hypothetical protein